MRRILGLGLTWDNGKLSPDGALGSLGSGRTFGRISKFGSARRWVQRIPCIFSIKRINWLATTNDANAKPITAMGLAHQPM